MTRNLVQSIVDKSTYKNYKIVVVDDGNSTEKTISLIKKLGAELFSYPLDKNKPFNFAHKANFCFNLAKSEYVILLNDDMEVISPSWIEALLEPMQDKVVGIVGARLIYANGRIQHSGVALHPKMHAIHLFHNSPSEMVSYSGFSHLIRNYSVVTGACLMTRKSILDEVKGYDENLEIDFNDTDFCLRVGQKGYRIVYTPYCELFHFEQSSLPRVSRRKNEEEYFVNRWGSIMKNDPMYNKNLF